VKEGRTKFVPKNWAKTYFEWMDNIEPWCISRQLWWGHQIPAWYGPDGHILCRRRPKKSRSHGGPALPRPPWKAWVMADE
jgi:valyl-tRNA synthetase